VRPLVVVSPHLDDAILSVGAAIAARVAAGQRVTIATVCSVVDDDHRPDHDRAAAAIVGADTIHLGIDDAPRRGYQVSWAGLCEVDDDTAIVDDIARRLAPVVAGDVEVWGPLGCGGHVDHRATLQAVLALRPDGSLYEERPYARQRGRVALAWARLGASVDDAHHAWPPATGIGRDLGADVGVGGEGYDECDDLVPFLTLVAAEPVAPIPAPWSLGCAGARWRRLACPVRLGERRLRQQALEAYQGEWPMFSVPEHHRGWPLTDAAEFLWARHSRTSLAPGTEGSGLLRRQPKKHQNALEPT